MARIASRDADRPLPRGLRAARRDGRCGRRLTRPRDVCVARPGGPLPPTAGRRRTGAGPTAAIGGGTGPLRDARP